MKYISRTVWVLSLISLFTDMASEMLYPVMPVYLKSIGFSIVLIGVLEGLAEATAGLSKGYFGKLSDDSGKRVPFVQLGYALSTLSKPMLAVFQFPIWIFFARTVDRFGKGIRTGARDAILSAETTPETKAKVFGFHRSMDTTGAVIGPALALLYLYFFPGDYVKLFYLAFIPGVLAVISSFYLKEKREKLLVQKPRPAFFSFLKYWKLSSASYRKLVAGLLFFTLINSSDVFLLLNVKQAGLGDSQVIVLYIFYNLVYALFAFPMGILGDKIGIKRIFIFGLFIYALVYFGMAFTNNLYFFITLFFLYGVYASATEGIAKAWIASVSEQKDMATAIGTFSGLQSICTLLASSLTGWVWFQFGAQTSFLMAAIFCLPLIFYFITLAGPANKNSA